METHPNCSVLYCVPQLYSVLSSSDRSNRARRIRLFSYDVLMFFFTRARPVCLSYG